MSVTPEYTNLEKLLLGKIFIVPEYQRAYSWEAKQRNDLRRDIEGLLPSNNQPATRKDHFMATIVCLEKEGDPIQIGAKEFSKFDIVDGQQRLTTLICLLKAAELHLPDDETSREIRTTLVKGDANILLLSNPDDYRVLEPFIRDGKEPNGIDIRTLSQRNLVNAIEWAMRFAREWRDAKRAIPDLVRIILNRLGFIFYPLKDESIVYTVFEVLNSRGLAVNWLDKAKSTMMGIIFEKLSQQDTDPRTMTEEIKAIWSDIYKEIGVRDIKERDVLTFAMTLLLPIDQGKAKVLDEEVCIENIRELCGNNIQETRKISRLILAVAQHLKRLSEIPHLDFFNEIKQVRLLYVAIHLSPLLKNEDKQKHRILELWERMSFKLYGIMRRDARNDVGDYVRLARDLYTGTIRSPFRPRDEPEAERDFVNGSIFDKARQRFKWIDKDVEWTSAQDALKTRDCYTDWRQELLYFMFRVEQHYSEKRAGNAPSRKYELSNLFGQKLDETIEHIFPNGEDVPPDWQGKMGMGRGTIQNNKNRLANLIVLPDVLNKICGQKSFMEKREHYKDAHFSHVDDIVYEDYLQKGQQRERQDWNIDEINRREGRLLDAAKEIWFCPIE